MAQQVAIVVCKIRECFWKSIGYRDETETEHFAVATRSIGIFSMLCTFPFALYIILDIKYSFERGLPLRMSSVLEL